ncbi:MAG: hypothetical protein ABSF26_27405 [Thermoguttaceae bacterium]
MCTVRIVPIAVAAAKICGNSPAAEPPHWSAPDGHLPEPWMNDVVRGLRADIQEEIPRIRIVKECPATRGFAPDDTLPWCGLSTDHFVQRQLEEVPATAANVQVMAVSVPGNRPVFLYEPVGRGAIYAMDLRSLDEPRITWDTRGSFNKYVFAGNLIGGSLTYGRYWNRKPRAEDWGPILRDVARRHPPLRVEVDGFVRGYNVYSLNLGDPTKPIWYAPGMYHAEDEWRSALGLVDFARYLADNRDDPAIRRQLDRFCVKIIPCQQPRMYMKALRGYDPGPEKQIPADPLRHGRPSWPSPSRSTNATPHCSMESTP